MQLVWKQHAIVVFDTCQLIKITSFLKPNTDALYMVTLNLYENKVPFINEEVFAVALYRWLRKFQKILPAFGPDWKIMYVSWDWVGTIALVLERKTTAS